MRAKLYLDNRDKEKRNGTCEKDRESEINYICDKCARFRVKQRTFFFFKKENLVCYSLSRHALWHLYTYLEFNAQRQYEVFFYKYVNIQKISFGKYL